MDVFTVHTSVETKAQADALSKSVLEARLAACVHTTPVNSAYWWQGEITSANEIALTFKTSADRLDALIAHIRENHPYEVAEILAYKCDRVDADYAAWAGMQTRHQ